MELYDHFKILNKKINFMWSEKRVDKERVKSTYHINKTIIENTPYIKIGNEDIYNHPNLKLPSKNILIKDNTHLLSLIHVNNWQYDTYITSPILIHVTHDNSNYIMFIDRDNNMKFHNAFQHLYLTKKQIEFSTQILDEFSKNNSEIINQYLKKV